MRRRMESRFHRSGSRPNPQRGGVAMVAPSSWWLDGHLSTRERDKMEVIGLLVIMGALVAPALILPVMFVVALVKG